MFLLSSASDDRESEEEQPGKGFEEESAIIQNELVLKPQYIQIEAEKDTFTCMICFLGSGNTTKLIKLDNKERANLCGPTIRIKNAEYLHQGCYKNLVKVNERMKND